MSTPAMRIPAEEEPAGRKSRYTVLELADGFQIEGRERSPVLVQLSPTRTTLEVYGLEPVQHLSNLGLYAYPALLSWVSSELMRPWQRPQAAPHWPGASEWARKQTARAINPRVYGQWQRLLGLVPEAKRLVAKAVFAATFSPRHGLETQEQLYQHPHLVADILHYRAAALACRYAWELVVNAGTMMPGRKAAGKIPPTLVAERLSAAFTYDARCGAWEVHTELLGNEALIELLASDWKALYAGGEAAGRSLRRTLMHLPGGVVRDATFFPYVASALSRPLQDRVEVLTLLQLAKKVARRETPPPWFLTLLVQARRAEILAALQRLQAHLHRPVLATSLGLEDLVTLLGDYVRVEPTRQHQGNMVGLAEKAIRWHRAHQEQTLQAKLARYDVEAKTALPSIQLPTLGSIRFLGTVREVVLEGEAMHHCIASYADQAVIGACYLFHVEYQGTSASVMVDDLGRVVQAYGPQNAQTPAAAYGRRALAHWGRALRESLKTAGEGQAHLPPPDLLPYL